MTPGFRNKSVWQPQGLLAPEILVTIAERRAGGVDSLPDALMRFCNWCVEEARLVRGEIQPDAWPIYHTGYYVAQVNNGGHGQFAGNSAMKPEVLDDIDAGLDKLGLDELLAVFRRFRSALEGDPALKNAAVEGGGFGTIPDAIREVDDAYFASRDPARFHEEASRWMRRAPTVVALNPRQLRERQAQIIVSNRMFAERRSATSRRSPLSLLADVATRLWNRTVSGRGDETVLDEARRDIPADRPPEWQVSDLHRHLIMELPPAVQDQDHERVDRIFAGFRDLHARHRLQATDRWPDHIRMFASRLHYAGERLGRPDLLEQAADAFGLTIATGSRYEYDPGFDWRSLGQSLVELARLDESKAPGLGEALDAFTNALAANAGRPNLDSTQGRSLLGRAEAHLVLAAKKGAVEQLKAASEALREARPLLRADDRNRWGAVNAELLSLQPSRHVRRRERDLALRRLEAAIEWETENEGDAAANPRRLERLRQLRNLLAG